MRGRKPKPTTLHDLQGTKNATRHKGRETEPKPTGSLFDPPDWLTDSQKEGWRYAVEHAPANLLKLIDRGVLVVWVVAEDRLRASVIAQGRLDAANSTLPLLTKGKDGPIESPYVRISERSSMVMLKAVSELGFSPAARPRLVGRSDSGPSADNSTNSTWAKLKLIHGGKAAG